MTDGVEFIGGLYEHWDRDHYINRDDLKAGKYWALVEFDWHRNIDKEKREFSFNNYGLGKTSIVDVTNSVDKIEYLK